MPSGYQNDTTGSRRPHHQGGGSGSGNHGNSRQHPDGHLVLSESFESFRDRFLATATEGELFEDPDFPTDESSLPLKQHSIVWRRPYKISGQYADKPFMLVDGTASSDVIQGNLGDCWFLAPCAGLARYKEHIGRVIPPNQTLHGPGYTGMVHFRFWRFGRWVTVVIDDRLPTKFPRGLVYVKSSDSNEYWPSLLEKAYAKLNGGYKGLDGGMAMDALVDLTSGLSETYDYSTEDIPEDLYGILYRSARTGAFMTCSTKNSDWQNTKANENGIVTGHSYTITDVQVIQMTNGQYVQLVRVRNPWANATEWKGDWSDKSSLWSFVPDQEKAKLKLKQSYDGEFWINYTDFLQQFNKVITCTVGPDFDGDGVADLRSRVGSSIQLLMVHGSWVPGLNAGGCSNHDTYNTNPQFVFTLSQPDEFDPWRDPATKHGKCSAVIALMQEYRRTREYIKPPREKIGFALFTAPGPNQRVHGNWLTERNNVGKSGSYINHREVQHRCLLSPGHYVIVPTTFNPIYSECSFILRIFTEKGISCNSFLNL